MPIRTATTIKGREAETGYGGRMRLMSVGRLGHILAAVLAATLLAASTSGCDSGDAEDARTIEYDEQLFESILELARAGEAGRLSDFTEFDWDSVYVYYEGASADDIARDVGSELDMGKYYSSAGCLMVFVHDDEVVRAISGPELIGWDGANRFTADVRLEPGRQGRPSGLLLQEPAQG